MTESLSVDCTLEQARVLEPYDHHRVRIGTRQGILLTYDWPELTEANAPFHLTVVFHEAMPKHPLAASEIQALIDQLPFTARD